MEIEKLFFLQLPGCENQMSLRFHTPALHSQPLKSIIGDMSEGEGRWTSSLDFNLAVILVQELLTDFFVLLPEIDARYHYPNYAERGHDDCRDKFDEHRIHKTGG